MLSPKNLNKGATTKKTTVAVAEGLYRGFGKLAKEGTFVPSFLLSFLKYYFFLKCFFRGKKSPHKINNQTKTAIRFPPSQVSKRA